MKIVYFIDHLRPDGTQYVLKQLIGGLSTRGHEQTVICLNDSWDDALRVKLQEFGARVHIIGKLPLAGGYGLLAILRLLKKEKFDVAVTFLFASDVIGRALAKAAGIPRIVTSIQTRDEFYRPWQRFLVRRTMPWADVVHLCSANIRDFAIAQEGADPDRIRIIPNSICVNNYQHPMKRAALRSEFEVPFDCLLIGSIGRLTHQKGFDVLLGALALIPRGDFHLLIAGVGEEEARLRALAAELGLGSRIHFAGYRRDVPHLLGALDLYVQPSRFEGMPIVILEAMAAGCPVVATAVDGSQELIEDGVHGWLVPAEDPAALGQAIQAALENLPEAGRRAQKARRRVAETFHEDHMLANWEGMLSSSAL